MFNEALFEFNFTWITWITSIRFWPHGFNITPPRNQCSSVAWKLWMADFSWPAFCCIKEKLLFWSPRSGLTDERLIQTNSFIVETRFGFERLPAGRLHITDWHKRINRPAPHLCGYYCTSRGHVLLSLKIWATSSGPCFLVSCNCTKGQQSVWKSHGERCVSAASSSCGTCNHASSLEIYWIYVYIRVTGRFDGW